jgi:hypothetical protein
MSVNFPAVMRPTLPKSMTVKHIVTLLGDWTSATRACRPTRGRRAILALSAAVLLLSSLTACDSGALTTGRAVSGFGADAEARMGPGTREPDVPETLAEATAAAQADIDRFSAGDFAWVWEHMTQDVRAGIDQDDFVTLYQTCKTIGQKFSVSGVRLNAGADDAVVSLTNRGVAHVRVMRYEYGGWEMAPTHDFATRLGKPVQQIIAEEKAEGLCGD